MSQVIKVSPSIANTSESNNSIDENNRNDTDSERGAIYPPMLQAGD